MKENVHFVDKASNPPNVSQARPIENLWGILAQKVYEGGWQASRQQGKNGLKFYEQCEDKTACHSGQWSASHFKKIILI